MKHNMGKTDRLIRAIIVAGIAYALITKSVGGVTAWILGVVALMLLVTVFTGFCLPYAFLGLKTCKCDEH